ncbi:MAG: DUF106 domain-containing protein [Candidatus Altiarchaeales archaeon]|nr:DUF106 domain-containing protein [Candidatus Altiarchaeales archaeon]MBD3415999.1 DUF106 domain-containing protein [Candidatus Altiarchaeales archaeon]
MLEITTAGQVIGVISAGMALMSSLVRHAVLDKDKLKSQKLKLKEKQSLMKEAQKSKDMKAMQKHQKEMMDLSMEQMRHGMKPMIFTIIPFILVFGWLRGTYGVAGYIYNVSVTDSLPPGIEFSGVEAGDGNYVKPTRQVSWEWEEIKPGEKGELSVNLIVDGSPEVGVSDTPTEVEYVFPNGTGASYMLGVNGGSSQLEVVKTQPETQGNKLTYNILYENTGSGTVASLFGFNLSWFWWYFLCSVLVSMILNKALGLT